MGRFDIFDDDRMTAPNQTQKQSPKPPWQAIWRFDDSAVVFAETLLTVDRLCKLEECSQSSQSGCFGGGADAYTE